VTTTGTPRRQLLVVAVLTLLVVVRGAYWICALEVWSPGDEAQHFGYVESLARGDGIPTVGRDLLSDDVMAITKASPTHFARSEPFSPSRDDENWGAGREQYEGIHGPTYYGLMVPAYWMGSLRSPLTALYAVRLASVLLAAAAIPLAWALARRLLPDRPLAWLLGPLLMVTLNGFTATGATVSNDILVVTGTVAALLLAVRAARSSRVLPAVVAGAIAGSIFVGKSTALGLFPLIVIVCIVQHVNGAATTARWVARTLAAGAGAALVVLPWIAWNLATYGAISGAEAAEAITGNLQESFEPGLDALQRHWEAARVTFWEAGLLTGEASYRHAWDLLAVVLSGLGLVAAARRWRRPEALTLTALALSFPMAFATMISFFFLVLGGSGLLLGRYVYVALVPLLLSLGAAALAIAGPRWAPALVLGIASFMLWQEIDLADHYLTATYETSDVDAALAPIVDQSWSDGLVFADEVRLDPGCAVEVIQVGLERQPDVLAVASDVGETSATLVASTDTGFDTYRLDTPLDGVLRFPVPTGSGIAVSVAEREPLASLAGASPDPLVRAWCDVGVGRAAEIRFDRAYDPQHPPATRSLLRAWPRAWFGLGLAGTALALLVALRRGPSPRP
jgi:hypothetical protein